MVRSQPLGITQLRYFLALAVRGALICNGSRIGVLLATVVFISQVVEFRNDSVEYNFVSGFGLYLTSFSEETAISMTAGSNLLFRFLKSEGDHYFSFNFFAVMCLAAVAAIPQDLTSTLHQATPTCGSMEFK